MVRRRAGGVRDPAHARISANETWFRGSIAVADAYEHRSRSGRSRILASNRVSKGFLQLGEVNGGGSGGVG